MRTLSNLTTDQNYQRAPELAEKFKEWLASKRQLEVVPLSVREKRYELAFNYNLDNERDRKTVETIRNLFEGNLTGHTLVAVDPTDRYLFQEQLSDLPLITGSLDRHSEIPVV